MPSIAPIVLFVYARPDHTRATLEALAANRLADRSDLIVYADAARNENDLEHVRAVRNLVRSAKGFRSITVIERETNYGLARNIIKGVTEVCNQYGRVIVLEDDIVTSPYFLTFMNTALDRYEGTPKVWHISGWNVPIDTVDTNSAFVWRMMECWGWATWKDRWSHFDKDTSFLMRANGISERYRFNLDGYIDYFSQISANARGDIDTWAVYWYAAIFLNGGLCVSPYQSLVTNIGLDGSGLHCRPATCSFGKVHLGGPVDIWPEMIVEDYEVVLKIKKFHQKKKTLLRRLMIKLSSWIQQ